MLTRGTVTIDGKVQKALIQELQWDHLGKELLHLDLVPPQHAGDDLNSPRGARARSRVKFVGVAVSSRKTNRCGATAAMAEFPQMALPTAPLPHSVPSTLAGAVGKRLRLLPEHSRKWMRETIG